MGEADASLLELVEAVRALPYRRPSDRTVAGMLRERRGTCSTKHLFLAEALAERFPETAPRIVHRLYTLDRARARDLFGASVAEAVPEDGLVDVHRYLTIALDGQRIEIDATFPGPAWDGRSPLPLACGPGQDYPAGDDPDAEKRALERQHCDPTVREPFIAALESPQGGKALTIGAGEALAHLRLASEVAGLDVGEVVGPTDHHLVVDGLRLHYLDWGGDGRRRLLFLHGGRLTAHTWDLVCLALRSRFRCVALDLRGHGDSEWSPDLDYEPDAHVRDVRGVIAHLGLEMPVLIGHSLGGLHGMVYAAEAARALAGLVLVDVAPRVDWAGAQRIIDSGLDDPGPGSLDDFVGRALALNPRRDPRLLRYSLRHNLRQLPDETWTWKYDPRRVTPERYASIKRNLAQLGAAASAISCPVLVVRGAESDVLSDAQAGEFAAALPDGRWTTVPSAAHNIQGDNPRGLVQALTDFLAGIDHC